MGAEEWGRGGGWRPLCEGSSQGCSSAALLPSQLSGRLEKREAALCTDSCRRPREGQSVRAALRR